jgi:hypothetical protein
MMMLSAYSQGKHTLSFGAGTENAFNGMSLPYNFSGLNVNFIYDYEKALKKNWKTFFDIDLQASFLTLNQRFSNNSEYNAHLNDYEINVGKSFLKRIINTKNFSFHAGLIMSFQGNYQIIYNAMAWDGLVNNDFLRLSLAEGVSTSFQLKLKRVIFQNTTSYLLLTASLHPNYSNDLPLFGGQNKDYFVLSTINKQDYLTNRFKIEFPLYIKGKFINSFVISHNLRYEHSTMKDNTYHKFAHTFNIGMIFQVKKLNIFLPDN